MNKLTRLSPTGIEYGDYAWNFASGCGNNVDGKCKSGGFKCWAYSITQRFKNHYPNGFKPTIYPEALCSPVYLKKPSRILCAFMGDLFFDCPEFDPDKKIHTLMPSGKASITMSLKGWIFTTIRQSPQHRFLFLTKNPSQLIRWGEFPDNCWVGVTATDRDRWFTAMWELQDIQAKVKYISFEPLLSWDTKMATDIHSSLMADWFRRSGINWVIIGSQTKPAIMPKMKWIDGIVQACDKARIPVFLKNNLKPLFEQVFSNCRVFSSPALDKQGNLRQELPK